MKVKIFVIAMLLATGVATANAQQQQKQNAPQPRLTPVEMANKQSEKMATELKLDEKQKKEVADINLKYAKLRDEVFKANQGNKEVLHSKMKEMNDQKKAELKKVLTADQFAQFQAWEKKLREERKQGRQSGEGGSQPNEK